MCSLFNDTVICNYLTFEICFPFIATTLVLLVDIFVSYMLTNLFNPIMLLFYYIIMIFHF
jgi:hypothetical protein